MTFESRETRQEARAAHAGQSADPFAALSGPCSIEARAAALREAAAQFGAHRAALIISGKGAALAGLEQRFVELLASEQELFRGLRGLAGDLYCIAREAHVATLRQRDASENSQLRSRLEKLELRTVEIGEAIGRLSPRSGNGPRAELDRSYQELKTAHTDLFDRFPTLPDRLEQIKYQAVTRGSETYLAADRSAIALNRALHWSKRDAGVVYNILASHSPDERALICKVYEERYGTPLLEKMRRAFTSRAGRLLNLMRVRELFSALEEVYGVEAGLVDAVKRFVLNRRASRDGIIDTLQRIVAQPHISRTEALLNGDRIQAATDTVALALRRPAERFAALVLLFSELSREELAEVERKFSATHAKRFHTSTLDEAIGKRCSDLESTALAALRLGDRPVFGAALLARACVRGAELPTVLHAVAAGEFGAAAAVRDAFESLRLEDRSLQRALRREPGEISDWRAAALAGDRHSAAAYRIRCSLKGRCQEWAAETFYDTPRSEWEEISSKYRALFGSGLLRDIKQRFGADEEDILDRLLRRGRLTVAEQLRHCLLGKKPDVAGITALLSGRGAGEQHAIGREYALSFKTKRGAQRDLDADLRRALSGHDRFDVSILRRGTPATVGELSRAIEDRYAHEHRGLLSRFLERHTADGRCMARDMATFRDVADSLESPRRLRSREWRRLWMLAELAANDFAAFREAKRATGNTAANLGSIAVATGATFTLAFIHSYWTLVGVVGAGSFIARTASKQAIKGPGYPRTELGLDAALSTIDGLTLLWGKYLRMLRLGGQWAAEVAVRASISTGLKTALRQGAFRTWGSLYREHQSRHHLRLEQLEREAQRARRGRSLTGSDQETRNALADEAIAGLRAVWRRGLRSR